MLYYCKLSTLCPNALSIIQARKPRTPARQSSSTLAGESRSSPSATLLQHAQPLNSALQLHAIVRGVRFAAEDLFLVRTISEYCRPSSRARITKAGAVRDQLYFLHRFFLYHPRSHTEHRVFGSRQFRARAHSKTFFNFFGFSFYDFVS